MTIFLVRYKSKWKFDSCSLNFILDFPPSLVKKPLSYHVIGGRNDWYPKASLCLKSAEEDSARKLKSRSTSKHNLPKLHEDNMYCKKERIDINDEIDRTQWIKRASSGDFIQNYKDDPSPTGIVLPRFNRNTSLIKTIQLHSSLITNYGFLLKLKVLLSWRVKS